MSDGNGSAPVTEPCRRRVRFEWTVVWVIAASAATVAVASWRPLPVDAVTLFFGLPLVAALAGGAVLAASWTLQTGPPGLADFLNVVGPIVVALVLAVLAWLGLLQHRLDTLERHTAAATPASPTSPGSPIAACNDPRSPGRPSSSRPAPASSDGCCSSRLPLSRGSGRGRLPWRCWS